MSKSRAIGNRATHTLRPDVGPRLGHAVTSDSVTAMALTMAGGYVKSVAIADLYERMPPGTPLARLHEALLAAREAGKITLSKDEMTPPAFWERRHKGRELMVGGYPRHVVYVVKTK